MPVIDLFMLVKATLMLQLTMTKNILINRNFGGAEGGI